MTDELLTEEELAKVKRLGWKSGDGEVMSE